MDASIIIPARNRAGQLKQILPILETQKTDHSYEVIVVDDGSSDGTEQLCSGHRVRYVRMERQVADKIRKAAEARNMGAKNASGRILIFLDADMLPGAGFVHSHIESSQDRKVVLGLRNEIVDGKTIPDSREPYFIACADDPMIMDTPWYLLYSHNFSLPKVDFDAVGGFSTYFDVWGAEDQELGYKLFKSGVSFVLSRSIIAVHQEHETEYNSLISKKTSVLKNALMFYRRYGDERIAAAFGLDKKRLILPINGTCNNNCMMCESHSPRETAPRTSSRRSWTRCLGTGMSSFRAASL
jgi:glycosyltransferase involved in cell wall biosynthesis